MLSSLTTRWCMVVFYFTALTRTLSSVRDLLSRSNGPFAQKPRFWKHLIVFCSRGHCPCPQLFISRGYEAAGGLPISHDQSLLWSLFDFSRGLWPGRSGFRGLPSPAQPGPCQLLQNGQWVVLCCSVSAEVKFKCPSNIRWNLLRP